MRLALHNIRYFAALAFVAVGGCTDADTPAVSLSADLQPALTAAPAGALRDDEIDPRDTYFAVNVTTTRTVEGDGSPDGMGTASLDSPDHATDESTYLEAGYGSDGALRFNVYSDGAADARLPAPPSVVRTVGNQVYVYDEWGSLAETYSFNDFLEGAGLPGGNLAVGSPYGSLYNPLGSRGGGGTKEPIYISGVDPERTKVHRIREDVLQITTVSGVGGDAGMRAAAGSGLGIQTSRTFRRRAVPTTDAAAAGTTGEAARAAAVAHWILESVDQTATTPGGRRSVTVRTRTTYRYVAAHIHRGKDQQRERAFGESPASAQSHASLPAGALRGTHAGAAVGTASVEDGIDVCRQGQANYTRTVTAGGGGVVYQHGFCATADTWSAMRQRVPETHRVGLEQSYSLNPDAPIESQVDDLAARLIQAGAPGNVVVAHSQGGLVARRLGQRRPDLVSGVVTIGTPHEGALVASRPAGMLADGIAGIITGGCAGNLMCQLFSDVAEAQAAGFISRTAGSLVPAAGDDRPGSALILRMNGRSEPQYEQFRRASIAMSVSPRWAIFRMIGDKDSDRARLLTNQPLKGRSYARDAQRLYDAGRVLRYMAMVLRWRATDYGYGWGCHQSLYSSSWEPCYNSGYSYNWWKASYWYHVADALDYLGGTVVWTLDTLDRLWDDATTGRAGGTDGFVQLSSQHYPSYVPGAFPIKQFQINGVEAHSGETASYDVLLRLQPALDHAGLFRR
ncbi:MAG TPA: alpha/beta hydrolase [Longimicrobium sp.]|jgi:pimeloyl-ACP methyl ester carboxylesterase|uniref:esterase/lipase family protein n=1 Tax=Longimicrobium sp. TaxID=2029185 RepID=UPI002ED93BE5